MAHPFGAAGVVAIAFVEFAGKHLHGAQYHKQPKRCSHQYLGGISVLGTGCYLVGSSFDICSAKLRRLAECDQSIRTSRLVNHSGECKQ